MTVVALLAVLAIACAPTSGGTATITDTGAASRGVEVGNISPPFAMQLADGSEVSLKNLVDNQQPVLMMYFATW